MKSNDCKGCRSIRQMCVIRQKGNDSFMCPCSSCIVKMICDIGCREYMDYCSLNLPKGYMTYKWLIYK
jgi:hypothetical protein